jgi:hypothetical protein
MKSANITIYGTVSDLCVSGCWVNLNIIFYEYPQSVLIQTLIDIQNKRFFAPGAAWPRMLGQRCFLSAHATSRPKIEKGVAQAY